MSKNERNFFYYESSDEYQREKRRLYFVVFFAVAALAITVFNEALKINGWSQNHWPFHDIELTKKVIRITSLLNIGAIPVLTISVAYLINLIFYYKSSRTEYHKKEHNTLKQLEILVFIVYDLSFSLCVAKKINCELSLAINTSTKDCKSSKCPMPEYCRDNVEFKCPFLNEFERCYSMSLDELVFSIENIKNTSPEHYTSLVSLYRYVLFLRNDNSLSKVYQAGHLIKALGSIYSYYKHDKPYTLKIIELLRASSNKYSSMLAMMIDSSKIIPLAPNVTKEEVLNNIYKEWNISQS